MNKIDVIHPAAPPGMDCKIAAMIGRRAEQQDAARSTSVVLGGQPALLVVVADGMGGAVGGRVASNVAVAAFEERFLATADQDVPARLTSALQAANNAIALEVRRDRSLQGMGCTLVGVVTDGREASWISVGDSLLLMTKPPGRMDRLNDDHSMGALLDQAAKRGEISRRQAENSNQRNMLRSALTGQAIALIDRGKIALEPGARLLLATDGILTLKLDRICRLANETPTAAALADAIMAAVGSRMPDDQDNLTVAVLDTPQPSPQARSMAPSFAEQSVPTWAKLAIGLGVAVAVMALGALAALKWPPRPITLTQPAVRAVDAQKPTSKSPSTAARSYAPKPIDPRWPLRVNPPPRLPTPAKVLDGRIARKPEENPAGAGRNLE